MQKTYLVAYDISDPKRLRSVYTLMKGYGDHLQLSVFRCDLCKRGRIELESALADIIDHRKDQVLFVDVGPANGRARRAFATVGRPYIDPERHAVIV